MNKQDISKEWIDTFNHLGGEGKLKAPVDYHAIFEADELFGKKIYTELSSNELENRLQ